MKIGKIVDWVLSIMIVVLIIGGLGAWDQKNQENDRIQEQKTQKFVKECLSAGGRVDEIGKTFTKTTLVCNPK